MYVYIYMYIYMYMYIYTYIYIKGELHIFPQDYYLLIEVSASKVVANHNYAHFC